MVFLGMFFEKQSVGKWLGSVIFENKLYYNNSIINFSPLTFTMSRYHDVVPCHPADMVQRFKTVRFTIIADKI